MTDPNSGTDVLERVFEVIRDRRGDDAETSNTARLFAKGRAKIAQKVGEEATEAIVAALAETPERLAAESADLLYHLMVLWAEVGITPDEVWAELGRREGLPSGRQADAETETS
ncbi:MAG: phosphoribosyl-ATP diphosphatase [Rhodospirillales bacterium]|jgi:phosphoribosyl-ATP pyrophosphohydrolase|nr:phosphoribosyl-ATP diphosphatase [Rhodospirillales bacterium]MDP6804080.1 phosphoribosyl-ATP diphosphatase [Rhodospirillales bacterium]